MSARRHTVCPDCHGPMLAPLHLDTAVMTDVSCDRCLYPDGVPAWVIKYRYARAQTRTARGSRE